MEHIIDIIEGTSINPMFIKANSFLIDSNKEQFKDVDLESKKELLEKLWLKTYNAELIKEKQHWSKIKFLDSKSLTMFQLRWS